jgi:holo-[acyl-carrier protein] synthase
MSIIGLGFDATDIPRVREVFERYGERFLHRVFTDAEIAYCTRQRDPVPSLAARFAAKEATMKALGTGHARGVLWRDIEVFRHGGPPQLRLSGGALRTSRPCARDARCSPSRTPKPSPWRRCCCCPSNRS